MKQITVFEKNDKIFFLKEGNNVNINGTKMIFRFVKSGLVTDVNDDFVTIMSEDLEAVKFAVESSYIFASEEEAKNKTKEINWLYYNEIKDLLKVVEKNYPLK